MCETTEPAPEPESPKSQKYPDDARVPELDVKNVTLPAPPVICAIVALSEHTGGDAVWAINAQQLVPEPEAEANTVYVVLGQRPKTVLPVKLPGTHV